MKGAALLAVVLFSCSCLDRGWSEDAVNGNEYRMPRGEIGEDFLSFLIAVIHRDYEVTLDREGLRREFPEFTGGAASLFDLLREVDRRRGVDHAELEFSFLDALHVPVPFGILWYHPIWIDTSGSVLLRESRFPLRTLPPRNGREAALSPEYEFHLEEGHAEIRIDAWLTVLTLGFLADFSFQALSLFKRDHDWYGLLAGRGPGDKPVAWLYNLHAMRVVLPLPDELAPLASQLLSEVH